MPRQIKLIYMSVHDPTIINFQYSLRIQIIIMKVLTVVCFVILINYSISSNDEIYFIGRANCMIRYLKNLKELEADIKELVTEYEVDCTEYLEKIISSDISNYLREIRNSRRFDDKQRICLENQFNVSTLSNLRMKASAYEVLGYFMNIPAKEKIKSFYKEHDREFERISLICSTLDEPQNGRKELKRKLKPKFGPAIEYCGKLYFIKQGDINITISKVDLNPENIDVESIDCKTEIKRAIQEFDQQIVDVTKLENPGISEEEIDCILEVYHNENFIWKSLFLMIQESIDMEVSYKNQKIKEFIAVSSSILDKVDLCIPKIGDDTSLNSQ